MAETQKGKESSLPKIHLGSNVFPFHFDVKTSGSIVGLRNEGRYHDVPPSHLDVPLEVLVKGYIGSVGYNL